ncbi:hypothetical protein Isop_2122 [Isosphaera pallida ATCC 43644]|uniref:Uncharacterized protein n=1 Tax=Isosphaera pallida (strain ATCC 43644 / DSM 9630 / IS1B) TaxID=575540 RepID=E8R4A1_ISOPI|nr:hypothetical protein Isop_2122 [Isosphaera pallida ATCC 43644]
MSLCPTITNSLFWFFSTHFFRLNSKLSMQSSTPHSEHPTPHSEHPTPHTPHPTPNTPHPTPHSLPITSLVSQDFQSDLGDRAIRIAFGFEAVVLGGAARIAST